ncbi:MAG: hypothetical protein SGJ24_20310 [Chloroflexota bacterium]|nr:hypothetical protein [Chloroflexota bacterium]
MHKGQVIYRGSPADLIEGARGHVWMLRGTRPGDDVTLVSSLQLHDGVHYRVVGDAARYVGALAAEPSLEDGYVWLMESRAAVRVAA